MASDDDPIESYGLPGGGRITAGIPDRTFGQLGTPGTFQVKYVNMENLESDRLIANVPGRDEAQRLVTGVGRAREHHTERSARARTVDEQKQAPMTTSYEQWARNPRRWDYPGVDDPRTNRKGFVASSENLAERFERGYTGVGAARADEVEWRDLERDL